MENEKYIRNCPKCGKEIYHGDSHTLKQSIKENRVCKSCVNNSTERNSKISKSCHIDRIKRYSIKENRDKLSESSKKRYSNLEERQKLSSIHIQRYLSIEERKKTSDAVKKVMHRPDIRKKHLEALHHSKWLKVRTDKGQLELLEKWNRLGFSFEPNFQIKTEQDLFYLDGYDEKRGVVLEYDTKYHNNFQQKRKDLIRQNKIINILNPKKFWRYDAVNRKFRNILGE